MQRVWVSLSGLMACLATVAAVVLLWTTGLWRYEWDSARHWLRLYDDSVRVTNDTDEPVQVRLCDDDHCNHGFDPIRFALAPGHSHKVGASSGPNVYLVETVDGRRLGCLPIVMPTPVSGLVALVSDRKPCEADLNWSQWPPSSPAS